MRDTGGQCHHLLLPVFVHIVHDKSPFPYCERSVWSNREAVGDGKHFWCTVSPALIPLLDQRHLRRQLLLPLLCRWGGWKVKDPSQGHTANEWQSHVNPGLYNPRIPWWSPMSCHSPGEFYLSSLKQKWAPGTRLVSGKIQLLELFQDPFLPFCTLDPLRVPPSSHFLPSCSCILRR